MIRSRLPLRGGVQHEDCPMKSSLARIGGLAAGVLLASGSASAQALEDLHTQRAEGGRWCMADHFHQGTSGGHSTRAAAEREAAASWSSFTALEYGSHWGSWRIAASKSMNCSNNVGSWGCQADARPCRPLMSGDAGARRKR